ncbi:Uncharacterised protein [Vibrio cholerae]|nr:Uncharacterised protein [Vibrio cholerae]
MLLYLACQPFGVTTRVNIKNWAKCTKRSKKFSLLCHFFFSGPQ